MTDDITHDPDDQHLRHRGESNPMAVRLVALALLLFWVGTVLTVRSCAELPPTAPPTTLPP